MQELGDAILRIEDRDQVRWLTLDRPHRKNAIPTEGWSELADALDDFEASDQRVLVVTGAGGDFCSGADLSDDEIGGLASTAANAARMRKVGKVAMSLHRSAKPTVAAVDGVAMGAGMNMALGCDIVVASDRVRFSEVFVRRGLTLDFGGTWLLPRIVGVTRAKELALTGRVVEAEEALALGLVTRVVPPDELERVARDLATELAAGPPLAQRFIKDAIRRSLEFSFEQALEFEDQAQAVLLASEDVAEGITAFQERRSPRFKGR